MYTEEEMLMAYEDGRLDENKFQTEKDYNRIKSTEWIKSFKKTNIIYYNFFDWWEAFTELTYSKNLEITESKDKIRDKWIESKFSINEGIKKFTR